VRAGVLALFLSLALFGQTSATSLGMAPAQAQDLDEEARAIGHLLRCPVCESLSVADSPSQLAVQMRELIRARLAAGDSREQILDYFAERYGDSVLLSPPKTGFTAIAWIAPYVGLAAAIAFLVWAVRRRPATAEPATEPDVEALLPEVDRTLDRLRDQPLR
jgi:cytochrome c-type biogenesis protein CcmH